MKNPPKCPRFKQLRNLLVGVVWLGVWCFIGLVPALDADQPGIQVPTPVTFAAVGDIMLGSDFPTPQLPPEDGRTLFDEVRDFFRQADVSFGNLEGTLCDGGLCAKNMESPNVYAFRTPTRFARTLRGAHLKVVSVANNHSMDFGYMGKLSTKRALREAGIQFAGKNGEMAEFTVRGVKVGLTAVTFGPPPRSLARPQEILREIESLAGKYDILVVSVHGGREGISALHIRDETEYFLGEHRGNLVRFARGAVDRGADLVLGHGPHVPRALDLYKGRLIAYSLGNFCTYKGMNLEGERGYAPLLWVELETTGAFNRGQIYSFIQYRPGGPRKDVKRRALGLMKTLSLKDFPVNSPLITSSGEVLPLPRAVKAGRSE